MGARFSAPVQTDPGAHPASCTMGSGSFPGVKSGRGVTLTPHPLLVPWSRKSRGIPLIPLWAVRPVQSLSACTRVHFTFYCCKFRDYEISVCRVSIDINFASTLITFWYSIPLRVCILGIRGVRCLAQHLYNFNSYY